MELLDILDILDARNVSDYLADDDVDDTLHRLKLDCKRDVNRLTYKPYKADKAKQQERYYKQKLKWINDE